MMGKKTLSTMGLVMVAAAVLAIGIVALFGCSKKLPDKIEVIGPFEVVTHTSRYATGWNTGDLGTATTEHYSLRFRGKPFVFDGKCGMWGDETKLYKAFNSVITFPTEEPAVVVNVGDPINACFFYLVQEEGGKAVAQYLGKSSGGVSAEWLDPPADEVLTVKNITLHRGDLEGGRWLLLGEYTVLDTQSLQSYTIQPVKDFSPNNFKPTIAMSPERRSFVRYGCSHHESNYPMLGVFEIESGSSYTLPVHKAWMRYNDWVEIDAVWLDHHFEWTKDKDGHFRLLERTEFEPLPYTGLLRNRHGNREYNLEPVKPEMRDRFIAFLENEYGAKIQPRAPHSPSDEFLIGQKKINVYLRENSLGIWMDTGTDSQFVEDIAKMFDGLLATRTLDDLFATSPSDRDAPPASATGRAGNFRATVVLTEDVEAFQAIWNRPPTVRPPPIRTLDQATIGTPVCAFVLFSGCARDARGHGSLKATFDVVRPDGSIVVTANDIPLWNAPAPPETHLQMAQQRWEVVFDEEERPGTLRIRTLVYDQIADKSVEISVPFELTATPR